MNEQDVINKDIAQLAADLNEKIINLVKIKFLAKKGLKSEIRNPFSSEGDLIEILLAIIDET